MKSLNRIALLLMLCLPVLSASPAWGQDKKPQDTSAAKADANSRDENIQEYVALMRADVRQQKAELLGAVMAFSASDAAKFWPIYSDYDAQLSKLNDQRVANIQDYARNYSEMTDDKADELVVKSLDYQKQRIELLSKTYQQVKEALGATTAARFVQVEHQLLLIIDLQIAASLPVIRED